MLWRNLVTYPNCIDGYSQHLLDQVSELIPVPTLQDRYSAMSQWFSTIEKSGVLTPAELWRCKSEIGKNL
jgi:hypothetical protein